MNHAKMDNMAIVPRTAVPTSHEGKLGKIYLSKFFFFLIPVDSLLTLSCRYWGTPCTFPSITAAVPQAFANHSLSKQRSVTKKEVVSTSKEHLQKTAISSETAL